jgi:hypothetical protein
MPISFFARRTRADLRAGPHFAAAVQAQSAFTSTSHIFNHHESNKTFHLLKVLLQMLYNGIVKLLPCVKANQSRICKTRAQHVTFPAANKTAQPAASGLHPSVLSIPEVTGEQRVHLSRQTTYELSCQAQLPIPCLKRVLLPPFAMRVPGRA